MTRALVLILLAVAAAALVPSHAAAHHWRPGACGLPSSQPLHAEYAEIGVPKLIRTGIFAPARPPLVLATSGKELGQELRAGGAHTVFWWMKLERVIGWTRAPADAATLEAGANRIFARAVSETGCSTPLIALNELQGGWTATPWSVTNAQYRANALELLRRLHDRGAHPYLLVTTSQRPFTDSPEAALWWNDVAAVADIVLQVHFNGRALYARGPLVGSRTRRQTMRRVLDQFTALGIPPARLGLLHGFQSGRGKGGREGLRLGNWLRVVKWEALAARAVAAERAAAGLPVGSDWSWGWANFPELSPVDPDKPITACVYLWVRDENLCDGPVRAWVRGAPYEESLEEGQILLPPAVHCAVAAPRRSVGTAAVERLAAVSGDPVAGPIGRPAAITALFARTVLWASAPVAAAEVVAAENLVVQTFFAGSREAYDAALRQAGLDVDMARGLLVDQLLARRVVASARTAALTNALATTTCLRDELPALEPVDLTRHVPFLRLP